MLLALLAPTLKTVEPVSETGGGTPWWVFVIVGVVVVAAGGVVLLLAVKKSGGPDEIPCPACGKIMMSDWAQCMFCKTPRDARPATIEFVSGPMMGRSVPLDGDVTTIGSAPGSTVTLSDAGVSRKHAGIRKAGGGYELADLGSTNGVYVNGEKVAKKRLQLGDVIRVGTTEMVFKG